MDKKEGTLHDATQSENFHWKTSRLWRVDMMLRMTRSVFTLQKNDIIHTDLKLENFLLDNMFYPVLSDFGYSFKRKDYESGKIDFEFITGTENYIAPELLQKRKDGKVNYSFMSDIYSLGVCFFYLTQQKSYGTSVKETSISLTSNSNKSILTLMD